MNRQDIFNWAKTQYGTEPDYPWTKYPEYAVLRGGNGKWYALVMRIPRSRLGGTDEHAVDVLNVKCDPLLIGSLRMQPGYYPAYHMSRANWITVLLDGTVPDEEIETLLAVSHALTAEKKRGKQ